MSYNLSILSKFPAVQSFSMNGWGPAAGSTRRARRSVVCAACFAPAPPQRWPYFSPAPLSPISPSAKLQRIEGSNNITSLSFARCAPRLVELPNGVASHVAEVEFQDINPRATTFFDELYGYFQTSRYTRAVSAHMGIKIQGNGRGTTADSPVFALWLDSDDFLFHWRKLLDGSKVEATAEDAEYGSPRVDSRALHEEFRLEWPLYIPTATHAASRQRKGGWTRVNPRVLNTQPVPVPGISVPGAGRVQNPYGSTRGW
ncbi:hypothetical protein B0H14DRAFT_2588737 [Mycena olivaceomarginata]|nr:hypothetical protein B0H14DRAFT_2588737 [Mycena olivaceomarginata]